ncbi:hypothetical protein FRC18_004482 [Serendipita sp. 400]|nr:hypothetical protein FRC18_004482 [Serendipita sp. 400]
MEALTLDSPKAIYSTAIAAPVVCWLVWSLLRKHREPYPPGPPGYPIIGSIFSFPKSGWQRAFTEWQKRYGDLIYANVLGSSYIIINSLSVAEDLCSRRANIYSNRPKNVMMTKLMGWEWNAGIMQPGPRHTAIRKLFRQTLGPQVIATYDPMIQKNAEDLIKKLHNFEGDPFEEIVSAVGAVVITVAYGENVYKDHGKELTQLGHEALETAIYVMTRFWLVEIFPSLRHIPAWTPGATFRQIGVKASQTTSKIYNWPWEEARRHYNEGTVGPCIAADCMEQGTPIGVAQDSVAVMFGAGVNTVNSSVFPLTEVADNLCRLRLP